MKATTLQAALQTLTTWEQVLSCGIKGFNLLVSRDPKSITATFSGNIKLNKRGEQVLAACKAGEISGENFEIKSMEGGVWVVATGVDCNHKFSQRTFVKA